jgi:hypothetical protein
VGITNLRLSEIFKLFGNLKLIQNLNIDAKVEAQVMQNSKIEI